MHVVCRMASVYLMPLPLVLGVFLFVREWAGLPEALAAPLALVSGVLSSGYARERQTVTPDAPEVVRFWLVLVLTFAGAWLVGGVAYLFWRRVGLPEWWAACPAALTGYAALKRAANHALPAPERDDHIQGRRAPAAFTPSERQQEALKDVFRRP